MALSEIKNAKQHEGEYFRRWFQDDYFDLIVFYGDKRKIAGFELCYNRFNDEHVFIWSKDSGFSHYRVDDGEPIADIHMTPIMVPDGAFPLQDVLHKYVKSSKNVSPEINKFIVKKINEFKKYIKKNKQ
ncbi:MAG: hypothetical protein JW871_06715 [Endomicrobiales bacterium]|nr:hypothetical protein [Endomicrobiales bacterium]